MNNRGWTNALVFTAALGVLAALFGSFAHGRFAWGPAENPKAQCEALEAATLPPPLKAALGIAYQARVATAIIREPQNTWSNLAFVFVGALIWSRDPRFYARLLAAALIALGVASGLYHASLLPSWRTIDVATMGWVSFSLCCVGLETALGGKILSSAAAIWFGCVGSLTAIIAAVFRNDFRIAGVKPFDSTYTTVAGVTGVFLLAAVGMIRTARGRDKSPPHPRRIAGLAALVGVAAFLQINDRPGGLCCAPEAAVQAHAVWHVLMAAASLLGYDLFRVLAGRSSLFTATIVSSDP